MSRLLRWFPGFLPPSRASCKKLGLVEIRAILGPNYGRILKCLGEMVHIRSWWCARLQDGIIAWEGIIVNQLNAGGESHEGAGRSRVNVIVVGFQRRNTTLSWSDMEWKVTDLVEFIAECSITNWSIFHGRIGYGNTRSEGNTRQVFLSESLVRNSCFEFDLNLSL